VRHDLGGERGAGAARGGCGLLGGRGHWCDSFVGAAAGAAMVAALVAT
jgi:hypothetical protein